MHRAPWDLDLHFLQAVPSATDKAPQSQSHTHSPWTSRACSLDPRRLRASAISRSPFTVFSDGASPDFKDGWPRERIARCQRRTPYTILKPIDGLREIEKYTVIVCLSPHLASAQGDRWRPNPWPLDFWYVRYRDNTTPGTERSLNPSPSKKKRMLGNLKLPERLQIRPLPGVTVRGGCHL